MNSQYARVTEHEKLEDDFDKALSHDLVPIRREASSDNPIASLLDGLVGGLSKKQAKNIKSVGIASGAGAIHSALSAHIGDVPAALIGAGISAWILKKLVRSRE